MKCSKCQRHFPESQIEESHNIPCYLFEGNTRNEKKNQADKYGRRMLCKSCHEDYENYILEILIRNILGKPSFDRILTADLRMTYMGAISKLPEDKKKKGIKICQVVKEEFFK